MIEWDTRVESNVNLEGISDWLLSSIEEPWKIKKLVYILVDDEELLQVNLDHLDHDFYTDIITFDYSRGNSIRGECWLSLDRILDNSKTAGVSFDQEFKRVCVHGLLHLMGYGDKSDEEVKMMREKEDEKLKGWQNVSRES